MPVILKTQKSFQKLSPWSNFMFPNEISQSAEFKAPKFQVKYNLVKRDSQREPVASVFEPTNYVPLVVQQPQIDFAANQRALAQAGQAAYERAILQQGMEPQVKMETEPQVKMETAVGGMQTEPQVKAETFTSGMQTEAFLGMPSEFFDTVTNLIESIESDAKAKVVQAQFQSNLKQDFINSFMYGRFKVPIEMAEELNTILDAARRVEVTVDKNGNVTLRKDSLYNQDLYKQLDDWLEVAVAAGTQAREFTTADATELIQKEVDNIMQYNPRKRKELASKFGVEVQRRKKIVNPKPQLGEDVITLRQQETLKRAKESKKAKRKNKGSMEMEIDEPSLTINTNVKRVQGPRAPTKPNFPKIDKSNIAATNIIKEKRRGASKKV